MKTARSGWNQGQVRHFKRILLLADGGYLLCGGTESYGVAGDAWKAMSRMRPQHLDPLTIVAEENHS
ncbi:MAG: hypothetical protein AB1714_08110 [Acidobacteriota bacterium]